MNAINCDCSFPGSIPSGGIESPSLMFLLSTFQFLFKDFLKRRWLHFGSKFGVVCEMWHIMIDLKDLIIADLNRSSLCCKWELRHDPLSLMIDALSMRPSEMLS